MGYFEESTSASERLAIRIFDGIGISSHKNNERVITDVDLLTNENIKIDVQYSRNFSKYGDCRIDIVSAFYPRNHFTDFEYKYNNNESFLSNFQKKYHCNIRKPGKVLLDGYLDALIVLFYDDDYDFGRMPDHILIVRADRIKAILENKPEYYFEKIKINDKSFYSLSDTHGSAFIPINANDLAQETDGFFGTYEDLLLNKSKVCAYLGVAR